MVIVVVERTFTDTLIATVPAPALLFPPLLVLFLLEERRGRFDLNLQLVGGSLLLVRLTVSSSASFLAVTLGSHLSKWVEHVWLGLVRLSGRRRPAVIVAVDYGTIGALDAFLDVSAQFAKSVLFLGAHR